MRLAVSCHVQNFNFIFENYLTSVLLVVHPALGGSLQQHKIHSTHNHRAKQHARDKHAHTDLRGDKTRYASKHQYKHKAPEIEDVSRLPAHVVAEKLVAGIHAPVLGHVC